MKRIKRHHRNIIATVAIIVTIIILLIILIPGGNENSVAKNEGQGQQELNVNTENNAPEINFEENKDGKDQQESDSLIENEEEPEPVNKLDEELDEASCEDYVLKQGWDAKVGGHTIKVEKIGKTTALVTVDGTEKLLSPGDFKYVNDISIEMKEDKLLYFAEDDDNNAVELVIGCMRGEDPKDKYVRDLGRDICTSLIDSCRIQFGIN